MRRVGAMTDAAVESLSSRLGGILADAFNEDEDEDELPGGPVPLKKTDGKEAPQDAPQDLSLIHISEPTRRS